MTPLTDAQLAAIAERAEKAQRRVWRPGHHDMFPSGPSGNEDSFDLVQYDVPKLLASHTALATRLAEAEQTIVQRVATIHGLSTIIDGHEAEVEDLGQRCDKAVADLAAAQATIGRLRTALETIRDVGMDEQGITRTTTVASAWECERVARAALAPEADDAT